MSANYFQMVQCKGDRERWEITDIDIWVGREVDGWMNGWIDMEVGRVKEMMDERMGGLIGR